MKHLPHPRDQSRESYLLISEHVQEGQRPLGTLPGTKELAEAISLLCPPASTHSHLLEPGNQGADLHPPTCRHPTPLSLHCSRPSPSSQACLSPGAAVPAPRRLREPCQHFRSSPRALGRSAPSNPASPGPVAAGPFLQSTGTQTLLTLHVPPSTLWRSTPANTLCVGTRPKECHEPQCASSPDWSQHHSKETPAPGREKGNHIHQSGCSPSSGLGTDTWSDYRPHPTTKPQGQHRESAL